MVCGCAKCQNNKPFDMPNEIIESAQQGELVLFCGAGISTENKNVLPYSFYTEILEELNLTDNTLSFSEVMQRYCDLPNGRKKLIRKIKDRFENIHAFPELKRAASEFHRELSELHFIKTIITTNWDTYFEDYCAAIPITIPEDYAFYNEHERFVLKIHGSINNLSTIVANKDDYDRCFMRLQKSVIGGKLKDIFARKTVVFIGFSFGDDDLNQIIDYVRCEMKELMPHIYIVSLDDTLEHRLNYDNVTYIITDGSFFLHQLKNICIEKHLVANCDAHRTVQDALNVALDFHNKTVKIEIHKNPCVIYTIAYQDGIIHAFERFLQMYPTGEYNDPCYMNRLILKYESITDERRKHGNYWDEAYYEGYLNALILIAMCTEEPNVIEDFPFFYLPNCEQPLNSLETLSKELDRLRDGNDDYCKYAQHLIIVFPKGSLFIIVLSESISSSSTIHINHLLRRIVP